MTYSRRNVARYAAKLLASGTKTQEVAHLLASYVIEHKQFRALETLISEVEYCLEKYHDQQTLHITSAHSLSEELKTKLKKEFGTAKSVSLEETIDPELLGGLIVETADKRFDGSLVTDLRRLKTIGNEQ
jgi:F-type H+-transporting ATPase subunit delta